MSKNIGVKNYISLRTLSEWTCESELLLNRFLSTKIILFSRAIFINLQTLEIALFLTKIVRKVIVIL